MKALEEARVAVAKAKEIQAPARIALAQAMATFALAEEVAALREFMTTPQIRFEGGEIDVRS